MAGIKKGQTKCLTPGERAEFDEIVADEREKRQAAAAEAAERKKREEQARLAAKRQQEADTKAERERRAREEDQRKATLKDQITEKLRATESAKTRPKGPESVAVPSLGVCSTFPGSGAGPGGCPSPKNVTGKGNGGANKPAAAGDGLGPFGPPTGEQIEASKKKDAAERDAAWREMTDKAGRLRVESFEDCEFKSWPLRKCIKSSGQGTWCRKCERARECPKMNSDAGCTAWATRNCAEPYCK